ncbi:hypothetical protein G9H71_02570 [Motilibacter sp. E257]|uniref:PNPLA domain-containing protein n=1 Tax=Motilibacter deserti TaxID=2714956 RepID=A0ABX0GSJ2_9ACTN|nr:hypothetical protein [Motilibacter deserti]
MHARIAGRTDHHRLALAVPGGAMRGIVTAGMLLALRDAGALRVFDSVYGVSSGAINVVRVATGGAWDDLKGYLDFARRPFSTSSLISLVEGLRFTDESLAVLPYSLNVVVTDVDGILPVWWDTRGRHATDVRQLLCASCWLPILAPHPFEYANKRYADGALLLTHPAEAAQADGATHVLALLSGAEVPARPHVLSFGRRVLARGLDLWAPELGSAYLRSRGSFQHNTGTATESGAAPHIDFLSPTSDGIRVTYWTRDPAALLAGAEAGYSAVTSMLKARPEGAK